MVLALAAAGELRRVEIDTSWFVGNAPGWVRLLAADARGAPVGALVDPEAGPPGAGSAWRAVLPKTRVQPDTRHRFLIAGAPVATHVRLDVIPDGGLARLRVNGEIVPDALAALRHGWRDALPEAQRQAVQRTSE